MLTLSVFRCTFSSRCRSFLSNDLEVGFLRGRTSRCISGVSVRDGVLSPPQSCRLICVLFLGLCVSPPRQSTVVPLCANFLTTAASETSSQQFPSGDPRPWSPIFFFNQILPPGHSVSLLLSYGKRALPFLKT